MNIKDIRRLSTRLNFHYSFTTVRKMAFLFVMVTGSIGLPGLSKTKDSESDQSRSAAEDLDLKEQAQRLQDLIDRAPRSVNLRLDVRFSTINGQSIESFFDQKILKELPRDLDSKLFVDSKISANSDYLGNVAVELKKLGYEPIKVWDEETDRRNITICPLKLTTHFHQGLERLRKAIADDPISAEAYHLISKFSPIYSHKEFIINHPQALLYQGWLVDEVHPTGQSQKKQTADREEALREFKSKWDIERQIQGRKQKLTDMAQLLGDLNSLGRLMNNACPEIKISSARVVHMNSKPKEKKLKPNSKSLVVSIDIRRSLYSQSPFGHDFELENSLTSDKNLHYEFDLSSCAPDFQRYCAKDKRYADYEDEGVKGTTGHLDCLSENLTRLQPQCQTHMRGVMEMEATEFNQRGIKLNLTRQRFVAPLAPVSPLEISQ